MHAAARDPISFLFILFASALVGLGGCAGVGVKTEGTSGVIAWRVDDITAVTRQVGGTPRDGQSFVLVLKNTSDRTIRFTQMEESRYRPQTNSSITRSNGTWVLGPGSEARFDRFTSLVCRSGQGCTDSGANQALFRFIFTGVDDENRPVEARINIALPPAANGRPPIVR